MSNQVYEFARQKVVLNNGQETYRPILRVKRTSMIPWFFESPWERICCIYGEYITMDLPFEPILTLDECNEHIDAYKNILKQKVEKNVKEELIENIEEQII